MEDQEEYTTCDRCGARILKKSAIEVDGLTLCGDCVVKETKIEVAQAEKIASERRAKQYEAQRKELAKQRSKKALIALAITVLVFVAAQWFMMQNKPQPVKTAAIDFSKDLDSSYTLIVVGLDKYAATNGKLPPSLSKLLEGYVPYPVGSAFRHFKYKRIDDHAYELEITSAKNTTPKIEVDNDPAANK